MPSDSLLHAPIPVGPFDLHEVVGKGGMGEVWRGLHREQRVPVAVKVITAASARQERYLAAFRNEVRAVARLDHPGIVWVVDYGLLDATAEAASEGAIVAGSPYLAMEYASGGTLHSVMHELDWPAVKRILLELLDALSHAHARGVVHRDLKPGNVLLSRTGDIRPGLKLTDFGIARAIDFEAEEIGSKPLGTLHYMAPEQVKTEWHEQGPWTDLYAVGCMAYRFLTGNLPFAGLKSVALMHAQVRKLPPAPVFRFPVPDGLQDWLMALIAKDPHHRFRRAADAASALQSLHDPYKPTSDTSSLAAQFSVSTRLSTRGIASERELTALVASPLPPDDDTAPSTPGPSRLAGVRPTPPRSWRRPIPTRPSPRLLGAGLGLWGIRTVPMVGREAERDQIWRAMREARRSNSPRLVIVRGPTGTGKTRLVQWIGERLEEVGAARHLEGRCVAGGPVGHGLVDLLVRSFRTRGLESADAAERLEHELDARKATDDPAVPSLRSVILPRAKTPHTSGVRIEASRFALGSFSTDRPLYVAFDNAHHDPDVLEFARRTVLDERDEELPAVLVLAVRDEDLADAPDLADEVAALCDLPATLVVELTDLKRSHRAVLVRQLLGLSPMLAAQVEQRTGGNPLFTMQLVSDWVDSDTLEVGPDGFALRDPDLAVMPRSLDDIWAERIRRVLVEAPESNLALERAAVLGEDVVLTEWSLVCDDPEGQIARAGQVYFQPEAARQRHRLTNALIRALLAEETDDGFRFTHGMFREAVLASARSSGRLESHHRSAARMLEVHGVGAADDERRALHLVAAGEADAAIPLLMEAIRRQQHMSLPAALELVGRAESALRKAGRDDDDRQWGRIALARCQVLMRLGRPQQAADPLESLTTLAEERGWADLQLDAALARAELALRLEDDNMLERALDLAARWPAIPRVASLLARVHSAMGDHEHAVATATSVEQPDEVAGWALLGRICLESGDVDSARTLLTHATAAYHGRDGSSMDLAETLVGLGRAEAERGDLRRAQQRLSEAVRLYRRAGSADEAHALLALAEVLSIRESWRDALLIWTHASRALGESAPPSLALLSVVGLLASSAGLSDWTACARHLAEAERLQSRLGSVLDPRTTPLLLETGHRTRRSQQPGLAARCLRLARRNHLLLGDTEAAAAADALLDEWTVNASSD